MKANRIQNHTPTARSIKKYTPIFSILFLVVFVMVSQNAFAQNAYPAALGLGLEWNMNSRYNFAGGAVLGLDINLPHSLALGLTVTGSYNFFGIAVLEPAVLFRWYFLRKGHTEFFLQADAGAFLIFEEEEATKWLLVMGGLRGGYRIPVGNSWYIEFYGRGGYPFAFGLGVMSGMRF